MTNGWAMERRGRALWKIENNPGLQGADRAVRDRAAIFDTNAQLHAGADAAPRGPR